MCLIGKTQLLCIWDHKESNMTEQLTCHFGSSYGQIIIILYSDSAILAGCFSLPLSSLSAGTATVIFLYHLSDHVNSLLGSFHQLLLTAHRINLNSSLWLHKPSKIQLPKISLTADGASCMGPLCSGDTKTIPRESLCTHSSVCLDHGSPSHMSLSGSSLVKRASPDADIENL